MACLKRGIAVSDAAETSHPAAASPSKHPFAGTRAEGAPRQPWSLGLFGRLLLGAIILGAILVGAGLLLAHTSKSWTHTDGSVDRWFVAHRMSPWNGITL